MILYALVPALLAGSVYINGVRADVLPEVSLTNATVRFDGQGNVWIDAPGYRVQVVAPVEYAGSGAPAATPVPPDRAPADGAPAGVWWLVTEDNGSSGHTLEVLVNGVLARRIASGEPQLIFDIGPFLRRGSNTVVVTALPGPTAQAPAAGGGALNVYIGRGTNLSGTIHLDNPDVAYRAVDLAGRATDGGSGGGRQYTLTVP